MRMVALTPAGVSMLEPLRIVAPPIELMPLTEISLVPWVVRIPIGCCGTSPGVPSGMCESGSAKLAPAQRCNAIKKRSRTIVSVGIGLKLIVSPGIPRAVFNVKSLSHGDHSRYLPLRVSVEMSFRQQIIKEASQAFFIPVSDECRKLKQSPPQVIRNEPR